MYIHICVNIHEKTIEEIKKKNYRKVKQGRGFVGGGGGKHFAIRAKSH